MAQASIFKASGTPYCGSFSKAKGAQRRVGVDCRDLLRLSGASLSRGSVFVTDLTDHTSPTGFLVRNAPELHEGIAEVMLKGGAGVSGHRYELLFVLNASDGEIYYEAILVIIR